MAETTLEVIFKFQHSLMNLGVETKKNIAPLRCLLPVSAFSDESWGGDLACFRPWLAL